MQNRPISFEWLNCHCCKRQKIYVCVCVYLVVYLSSTYSLSAVWCWVSKSPHCSSDSVRSYELFLCNILNSIHLHGHRLPSFLVRVLCMIPLYWKIVVFLIHDLSAYENCHIFSARCDWYTFEVLYKFRHVCRFTKIKCRVLPVHMMLCSKAVVLKNFVRGPHKVHLPSLATPHTFWQNIIGLNSV